MAFPIREDNVPGTHPHDLGDNGTLGGSGTHDGHAAMVPDPPDAPGYGLGPDAEAQSRGNSASIQSMFERGIDGAAPPGSGFSVPLISQ